MGTGFGKKAPYSKTEEKHLEENMGMYGIFLIGTASSRGR